MMVHGMRKKILAAVCVFIIPALLFSCKKSLGDRWVDSMPGITIYTDADEKSAMVTLVPGGEKVEALQEKSGRPDPAVKWTEIRWDGKTGWALSTSLKSSPIVPQAPTESSFPAETIIPLPELEATAKEFYENRLKKALGEMQDRMIAELVVKLHKFGYSVKYKLGDYAVVKHGESFGGPPTDINTYSHADALWQKKDGRWSEIIPAGNWGGSMHLYQMNNDEFPDVLVKKCVSDACTLLVYLGKPDGTFQLLETPGNTGEFPEVGGTVLKIGKCGGTSLEFPDGAEKILITFDCAKNVLVKTKK